MHCDLHDCLYLIPGQEELPTLASADRRLLLQKWLQRLSNAHLTPPGDDPVKPPGGDPAKSAGDDTTTARNDCYDSVLRREFEDAPEQSDVVTVAAVGWSECLHPGVDNEGIRQRLGEFLRWNWDDDAL